MTNTALFSAGHRAAARIKDAATVMMIVGIGAGLLKGPVRRLAESRRASIGAHVVTARDSAVDNRGVSHALLARDSLTVLVFFDATCTRCVTRAKAYAALVPALVQWAVLQGVAVRLLSPDSGTSVRYGIASGSDGAFMTAGQPLYARLGMSVIPSALFVDSTGFERATLAGRRTN